MQREAAETLLHLYKRGPSHCPPETPWLVSHQLRDNGLGLGQDSPHWQTSASRDAETNTRNNTNVGVNGWSPGGLLLWFGPASLGRPRPQWLEGASGGTTQWVAKGCAHCKRHHISPYSAGGLGWGEGEWQMRLGSGQDWGHQISTKQDTETYLNNNRHWFSVDSPFWRANQQQLSKQNKANKTNLN